MPHSGVYVAILILVNLNYFIECGGKRQTVCLKELDAFSVPKTTANASSDTRPNTCSTVFGCCNKTIEDEMKTHITQKLINLVHQRNERLRRQFKGVYDDLEDLFLNIFEETAGRAFDSLKSKGNIAQHATPYIRTLFEELRTSVTNKDLHVKNSTTTFFRNFYPAVYQNVVAKTKFPNEFAQCLKDNVQEIMPFEDVPQKLTDFLTKKLIPVQLYLRSLQTIGHVLDVIDNVELSKECGFALVKMSYCSLCDGFSDAKPCQKYCTNVVSSCLEPYSVVEEQWISYMTELDNFRDLLANSLDAFVLSAKLQEFLSDSISHASHSKVAAKVLKYCGNMTDYNENKIISLNAKKQTDFPTRDLGNGDLYIETTNVQSSYQHLPTSADISKRLIFLHKNLTSMKNHLKMFHINLCLNDGLSAIESDRCWVGTGLGRYNAASGVMKNITTLKPANNDTIVEDVLLLLKEASREIRKVISRPWKIDGSGSGTDNGSASGEGSGETTTDASNYSGEGSTSPDCNDDDEDCAEQSGDDNVHADEPVKNNVDQERSTESADAVTTKSGASTFYCTQTLLVGVLLLYLVYLR